MSIITAYCACTICCGPRETGLTASGHHPIQGTTIAAPRSIPLGTKVAIGNHVYTVQDRTARRFDGRWDIYFASHKDALRFGKQTLQITICK